MPVLLKKSMARKKQYILVHSHRLCLKKNPLCHTFLRKCIFIRLSHSVNTPVNVSLTMHHNYYLGVLMIPFQTNVACR